MYRSKRKLKIKMATMPGSRCVRLGWLAVFPGNTVAVQSITPAMPTIVRRSVVADTNAAGAGAEAAAEEGTAEVEAEAESEAGGDTKATVTNGKPHKAVAPLLSQLPAHLLPLGVRLRVSVGTVSHRWPSSERKEERARPRSEARA